MTDESPFPFPAATHICTPAPKNDEEKEALRQLREQLETSNNAAYLYAKSWCTDAQLVRFLVARQYVVEKAFVLTLSACEWRQNRKPSEIESQPDWQETLSKEAETGKIYCPGFDRFQRPVIVFDNSVQNTTDHDGQIKFLAWNLELGCREMGPGVDKYVIFINLQNFSLKNNPSLQTTKETIKMLCDCFPERLGHLFFYQPPWIFKGIFEAVKGFIDPKTVSKVYFMQGDDSDGTENDLKMRSIIGDNWRTLTGAGQPVLEEGCSPGYDFMVYWSQVMKRVIALQAKEAAAAAALSTESNGEDGSSGVDKAASEVVDKVSGLELNSDGKEKDNDDKMPETVFQSTAATAAASVGDKRSNT